MNLLITGGTGFVGTALTKALQERKQHTFVVASRQPQLSTDCTYRTIDGLHSTTDWGPLLKDCDVVIHCAARVHVMEDRAPAPLAEFRKVNTFGTLHLARSAARAGVKRFVFLSSIKVSGESTAPGAPFQSSDLPHPTDAYGISKYEAEQGLFALAAKTGMEVVVIRPPLVYGPNVKGNFASMLKLVSTGLPLPFAAMTNNLRSLVAVDNLVDLLLLCVSHPKAANQVFLVSDDEDISTAGMFRQLSSALGTNTLHLPVPTRLFRLAGRVTGKTGVVDRLLGNLQVDISATKSRLGWHPVMSLSDAFAQTARRFQDSNQSPRAYV